MQRWKVGALLGALLLAAPGCALESGEPGSSSLDGEPVGTANNALTEAAPSGASAASRAGGGSQQGVTAASPVVDPGQQAADNGSPTKPQPDPWKAANGGGKPQPDPWNPGSSTVSTTADH